MAISGLAAVFLRNGALALIALALLAGVSTAYAQETDAELRATVRAAILSDPRTAELSAEEVEALVSALTEEAAAADITSADIAWQPRVIPEAVPQEPRCGILPAFLCSINEAFGLDGSDLAIPIGLAITSALLLFIIGSILLHRHGHHPFAGEIGTPPKAPPA